MLHVGRKIISLMLLHAGSMSLRAASGMCAVTPEQLNQRAHNALRKLCKSHSLASAINKQARAVLVFPRIDKAGLILSSSCGDGVLLKGGIVISYFSSVIRSWVLQPGTQSFGYVVFLMDDNFSHYVQDTDGWEIGIGPSVVVVTDNVAKHLSTSSLNDGAYAFVFNQQGLILGVSIDGTRISRVKR